MSSLAGLCSDSKLRWEIFCIVQSYFNVNDLTLFFVFNNAAGSELCPSVVVYVDEQHAAVRITAPDQSHARKRITKHNPVQGRKDVAQ